jgi:hypothetical protein
LARCAALTERHVAAGGWDQPPRLFAVVATARLLEAEPRLRDQLDTDEADALSAIEQDDLPEAATIEELVGRLAWPPEVDGVALAVERVVLPPSAAADLPGDPHEAAAAAAQHPDRADVRLLVAVLRDGQSTCLLRQRAHDRDDLVAMGADIAPGLTEALAGTLVQG